MIDNLILETSIQDDILEYDFLNPSKETLTSQSASDAEKWFEFVRSGYNYNLYSDSDSGSWPLHGVSCGITSKIMKTAIDYVKYEIVGRAVDNVVGRVTNHINDVSAMYDKYSKHNKARRK